MRILIAEDDPYSLLILRRMLEKEPSWEVQTAENGAEAWDRLLNSAVFDLCILDIMMPDMTGLQLAARMRADPRFEDQPIIFCTALNDRSSVEQAAGLSASHYITKPYTREHIIRQVRRTAANRASCGRIEAAAKVAGRLGLEPADVGEMLRRLHAELDGLTSRMIASAATEPSAAEAIRVNALKGAAANLGARRLAEELGALETVRPDSDWQQILKRVAAENEHLRRCLEAKGQSEPVQAAMNAP